uniref:IQ domain-containing protein E isoform X2 n=1 Tax=Doryrhamphus excisus TaxID=161450 RepID=UPI0025AE94F0|nr:IQ domain-containing protein E isoform X2 [Doryrhamphus excisus]
MSAGASDVLTDEDCEVLTPKKRSGKPPPPFRSPYFSSLNMNARRGPPAAVTAWRLPRASMCDTPGETGSARLTSLSNHHDQISDWTLTPDFPRHALPPKKHLHSSSNGVCDYREKEDIQSELMLLKKSLHEQKSDNHKLKAKIRRLEEDNAKREKQLEELLDPTNKSEYTRSLVDKKHEGSVVANGLKQRILKLEQQCREKENTIGKLQSQLRATNLEEMRMTLKNYCGEIQRLRLLLEASEKSGISDNKVFRRQQKALSSTVLRLSENLKQIQLENATLREELDTESPAVGLKGYKEWSKYRLLRRLLELERRLEESTRNANRTIQQWDQECQTTPPAVLHQASQTTAARTLDLAVQTTPTKTITTGTTTEADEAPDLRGCVTQLEAERAGLQESLSSKEDEVRQLRTERVGWEDERQLHTEVVEQLKMEKEELEQMLERWKAEQTSQRELDRRRHEEEVQQLRTERERLEKECQQQRQQQDEYQSLLGQEPRQLRVQALEEKHEPSDPALAAASQEDDADDEVEEEDEEEEEEGGCERPRWDVNVINRRKYRSEAGDSTPPCHSQALDELSLTAIQSAFRGHLARSQHMTHSLGSFDSSASGNVPTELAPRGHLSASGPNPAGPAPHTHQTDTQDPWPVSGTPPKAQAELLCTGELDAGDDIHSQDSDDSDDIIVAESYPRRNRETRIL